MTENDHIKNDILPDEITDNLSPEGRRIVEDNPEAVEVALLQRELNIFQGPLPHPDVLKGYAEVDPSFPDRVIGLTENQSQHRQNLENTVVEANIKNQRRGSIFAFILGLITIVGAFVLLYTGKSVTGMSSLLLAVGSLAGVFVYGKKGEIKEIRKKDDELMNNEKE